MSVQTDNTEEVVLEETVDETAGQATDETPQGTTGTVEDEATGEEQVDEGFNPDDVDFTNTGEELQVFNDLSDVGIDINSDNFRNFISGMEEMGITDQDTIKKLARGLSKQHKEMTKPKPKAEVVSNLKANLSKEEIGNYNNLRNIVKNAFSGTELEKEYNSVMSDPLMVRAIHRIVSVTNSNRGISNNPTTGAVATTKNYITLEQANKMASTELINLRKNNNFNDKSKKDAIMSIATKLPSEIANKFLMEHNI